jgi:predicted flap endonuclease-1-like 5' DNA nuclease
MNSGSFSLEPVSQDGVLVTIALVVVAIAAILTVIAMIVGARNKRARRAAEADEQQRIADLKAEGVETAPPAGTPAAARAPVAAPTAPAAVPSPEPTPADQPPAEAPLADEPIAAAAPLDATPASIAADARSPAPATAAAASADPGAQPVSLLKGLGPKIAARLAELGITRVDQLAWIDDAEAAELDAHLSPFEGRMERDRWREQARLLAGGDRGAYEAQFGKLG